MLTVGFSGLLAAQLVGVLGLRRRGYELLSTVAMVVLVMFALVNMSRALFG